MSKPSWGDYFENPNLCPYCKSDGLEGQGFDEGIQEVLCVECGESWTDTYEFSGVIAGGILSIPIPGERVRAKAPELLGRLQLCLEWIEQTQEDFGLEDNGVAEDTRALIAEIEGGSDA